MTLPSFNARACFLSIVFLMLCIKMQAQAQWNNTSFVHRSNQQIRDGQNKVISLDGVNLGGWLMWEGWIWGGGYTQEKTIYNNIKSIIGTPAADAFRDSVYKTYITRADIKKISEECYNVVRIPFNHQLLEDDATPYVYKPQGWAVLDSVLKWCEDYNVYAVLDLHSAPGGQSNGFTADPDFLINLWNGAVNQKRTKRLWKAIASRYKNRGIIAGYDLLNEPDVNSDSSLLAMYRDIIDSVRLVDNNHMIFLEGNNLAADFGMFSTLPDPNVCFQFHMYTWFYPNSIPSHLSVWTQFSNSINAPIWCGEWGENNLVQLDTTISLLKNPLYKVSGHAFWTWKKMKFIGSTYPYYNGIDTASLWNKTIKWISNTNQPTPTVAEMQSGISQFLQHSRLVNTTFGSPVSAIIKDCSVTAVNTLSENDGPLVYPNPFTDRLHIANSASTPAYELLDAMGRVVKTGKNLAEENLYELPAGLYILKLYEKNYSKNYKLMKAY